MNLQHDRLGAIPRDPLVEPGGTAGDHAGHAKAAAGADDVREVDVAPHGRAGNDQFPWC